MYHITARRIMNKIFNLPFYTTYITSIDLETKSFFAAVGDAEEILGALVSPGVHKSFEVEGLKGFVRILQALIMIKIPIIETTEWGNNTNFNQTLIGISEEEWKMISHYESVNTLSPLSQSKVQITKEQTKVEREEAVLRYAADELCRLIKDEIVPMRYVRTRTRTHARTSIRLFFWH